MHLCLQALVALESSGCGIRYLGRSGVAQVQGLQVSG